MTVTHDTQADEEAPEMQKVEATVPVASVKDGSLTGPWGEKLLPRARRAAEKLWDGRHDDAAAQLVDELIEYCELLYEATARLDRLRNHAYLELSRANEVWFTDPDEARSRVQGALGLVTEVEE